MAWTDLKRPEVAKAWRNIFAQVRFSEMPPLDHNPRPGAVEKEKFLTDVESSLASYGFGVGMAEKAMLPEYGNFVDHDLLFSGKIKLPAATPARLWRRRRLIIRRN